MAMTWAWGLTDLDQSQTLVLLALADAANDEGVCWPSQAEIGRKARLKDRAVRNQIRSLEAAGLLSVSRRATPQGRKTNVYRLNIGCDFSLQSKQPARNAGWVPNRHRDAGCNRHRDAGCFYIPNPQYSNPQPYPTLPGPQGGARIRSGQVRSGL